MTMPPGSSVLLLVANTRDTVGSTPIRIGASGNASVAATRSAAPSMIVSVLSRALPT
jgi:hypothetical protein